jgi:hypothetical protein
MRLKEGHGHLALVKDARGILLGVITLEDIVEEIIQGEIMDETDIHVDHVKKKKSRFRLLNAEARESMLSGEEVKALASHLLLNIPIFHDSKKIPNKDCLRWILHQSKVVVVEDDSREIYTKGKPADFSLIVLTGRLEIQSGENEYRKDAGSLSVVAPEALFQDKFVPDFTAVISSGKCRMVVIKRPIVQAACKVYQFENWPAGDGTDPNVRNAFAYQLFARRSRREGLTPASRPLRGDHSQTPNENAASEPPDLADWEQMQQLEVSYSTSHLPRV